jgi:hypothetical protein
VTVSSSKYLPWQAMHFLQRSTHFSKTYCRPLITSKFLTSYLTAGKAQNRMGRDPDCMADVLRGFHRSTFCKSNTEFNSDLAPCDFWAFPTMKMELRGKKFRSDQLSVGLFEKWVERCKKRIACRERYFEKRPSPHLHKVPTRSNKVSP